MAYCLARLSPLDSRLKGGRMECEKTQIRLLGVMNCIAESKT